MTTEADLVPAGWVYRPGTFDPNIFDSVHTLNEYGLPETFEWNAQIVDIGTHIGSFAYTCLMRGADRVYGYEVNPENLGIAASNFSLFGEQFMPHLVAVWRSGGHGTDLLSFSPHPEPMNTGGGDVLHLGGRPVLATTSLDEIVRNVGHVRLVRLDCEGAEYPILYTASDSTFEQIEEIIGEWHIPAMGNLSGLYDPVDIPEFLPDALGVFLERKGYEISWWADENDDALGKFRAVRR